MTAGLLMLSPLTVGLISSVIMVSAPLPLAAQNCNYTKAATLRWALRTKCANDQWNTACLQSLTPNEVYNAVKSTGQTTLLGAPDWTSNFSPCVDNVLISAPPLALILQGKYNKLPVLAGFTSNESAIFTRNWVNDISKYTDDNFDQFISRCVRDFAFSQRSCCNTARLQIC
jgi:carboxylesterase type B